MTESEEIELLVRGRKYILDNSDSRRRVFNPRREVRFGEFKLRVNSDHRRMTLTVLYADEVVFDCRSYDTRTTLDQLRAAEALRQLRLDQVLANLSTIQVEDQ